MINIYAVFDKKTDQLLFITPTYMIQQDFLQLWDKFTITELNYCPIKH